MSGDTFSFLTDSLTSSNPPEFMSELKETPRNYKDIFQDWWVKKASNCPACSKAKICNISNEYCRADKCFFLFVLGVHWNSDTNEIDSVETTYI